MTRKIIHSDHAPKAIGPYSQAVRCGNTVYLSGQTPIDPATGKLVEGSIEVQTTRIFENLKAVVTAAGGSFEQIARVGIYLTNLANFAEVNKVMASYFSEPYPARSTIGVSQLPLGSQVEIDAILVLDQA